MNVGIGSVVPDLLDVWEVRTPDGGVSECLCKRWNGLRQAKPWRGGSDELETFHRRPVGSTPARQRRSPPAGTECCVARGNARREAYTGGGKATNIEPRNIQCWCLHDSPNAKGNFRFEREIVHWRDRLLIDLRRKR